jgi:hypothetical protein
VLSTIIIHTHPIRLHSIIGRQTIPYLDDKQIKNLPRLVDLKPETFVDWYSAMESELLMISSVGLLPFDAIKTNYQYVGLCIPGVGEKNIWR